MSKHILKWVRILSGIYMISRLAGHAQPKLNWARVRARLVWKSSHPQAGLISSQLSWTRAQSCSSCFSSSTTCEGYLAWARARIWLYYLIFILYIILLINMFNCVHIRVATREQMPWGWWSYRLTPIVFPISISFWEFFLCHSWISTSIYVIPKRSVFFTKPGQ